MKDFILVITPDRHNYITPICDYLKYELVFRDIVLDVDLEKEIPLAVIFLGDWLYEHEVFIKKCKHYNIPTILMMDGTIEWKHFFENPKWSFGGKAAPYFPVLCDKIFVPGPSTYRFLDFFGNQGKCEITGLPRFDRYNQSQTKKVLNNGTKIIGVMSGNTAGYTNEQIQQSKKLFEDIYKWAGNQSKIDVIWRLRKGFSKTLDFPIENDISDNLEEFLGNVDAVVCQPSTAAYEAMLLGVPVAIADYSIAPNYMKAAWEIKGSEQIDLVINSLINPEPIKVMLQQHLLEDTLSSIGNSSAVAAQLINDIIQLKLESPNKELPADLYIKYIDGKTNTSSFTESLFPNQTAYHFNDLALLKEAYAKLESHLNKLEKQLHRRTPGFWMERLISKILK